MVSLHQLNSKNNGLVFLMKDYLAALESVSVCRLLLRMAGVEMGETFILKLILKNGPFFSSSDAMSSKITKTIIMVSSPFQNSFDIVVIVLQAHFMCV